MWSPAMAHNGGTRGRPRRPDPCDTWISSHLLSVSHQTVISSEEFNSGWFVEFVAVLLDHEFHGAAQPQAKAWTKPQMNADLRSSVVSCCAQEFSSHFYLHAQFANCLTDGRSLGI